MKNPSQDYAWGSHSFIQTLTGNPEKSGKPVAELWMGAHPKAPSRIIVQKQEIPLDRFLEGHPQVLGPGSQAWQGLPFLVKVLAASSPLSIQAHPNQAQAREGFTRENRLGIPPDHPRRNYKDPNHKPELICALTPFSALCGFRPFNQIIAGLKRIGIDDLLPQAGQFVRNPSVSSWKSCFEALLAMDVKLTAQAVYRAIQSSGSLEDSWMPDALEWVGKLADIFPDDAGVLAPLYLNLVRLQPLQALYLEAGVPHAYLEGAGIEVMANSDNVLRGGLTPKHIDPDELVGVLRFEGSEPEVLTAGLCESGLSCFASPAKEFKLCYSALRTGHQVSLSCSGPAIVLCVEGTANLSQGYEHLNIRKGESAFSEASHTALTLTGEGIVFICTSGC